MEWNKEDTLALLSFKDMIDCDDIKIKEKIKKMLLNNRYIIHVLNNKELEDADAEPDDYYISPSNKTVPPTASILPYYYSIPDTQSNNMNYLCFDVGYKELYRYNNTTKILQITFYILCYQGDILDEDTGLARHDLLAALIQDQFNYNADLGGGKFVLVSDLPSSTDTNYVTRTMIFEQSTDANLVKTIGKNSYFSNKINYNRYDK